MANLRYLNEPKKVTGKYFQELFCKDSVKPSYTNIVIKIIEMGQSHSQHPLLITIEAYGRNKQEAVTNLVLNVRGKSDISADTVCIKCTDVDCRGHLNLQYRGIRRPICVSSCGNGLFRAHCTL